MGEPYIGNDSRRYTGPIRLRLGELADEMREGSKMVGDEKAKALLETGAEVVTGLMKAFEDYEARDEAAWL